MKFLSNLIFVSLIILTACTTHNEADTFAEKIEKAHQKADFMNKSAISFDFIMHAGGNKQMEATYTATPDLSKIRMEMDSVTVIYDGKQVYQMPPETDYARARFDIFTWSYFLTMPFKLTDPGTQWEEFSPDSLNGRHYPAQKLTFKPGTGDTPDDWYVVYQDPETNRLHASAYIVTFGKSKKKAEENPHAIVYNGYKDFNGVPLSTDWKLTTWHKNKGIGNTLSTIQIKNISFVDIPDNAFEVPEDAKPVPLKQ